MGNRTINVAGVLSAAVAVGAAFTVSYPSRPAPQQGSYSGGSFFGSVGHSLVMGQANLAYPVGFSLTFGTAGSFTVTNKTLAAWPVGTAWTLTLDLGGKAAYRTSGQPVNRMKRSDTFTVDFGNPAVAAANTISVSANVLAATPTGAVLTSLPYIMDVPRNVVGAWTNNAIVTVTGKDEYGQTMVEKSALAAVFLGKKAFASITSITTSADIVAATFGTGVTLGFPVFIPMANSVIDETINGIPATAGVTVPGDTTAGGSTATTGDVRGTYTPNTPPAVGNTFQVVVALPDPAAIGMPQYPGP